jgi:hypothetical protein
MNQVTAGQIKIEIVTTPEQWLETNGLSKGGHNLQNCSAAQWPIIRVYEGTLSCPQSALNASELFNYDTFCNQNGANFFFSLK